MMALVGLTALADVDLNGLWDFRFEELKSLEEVEIDAFTATDKMNVPGCWDMSVDYFGKRGTGLYRRTFTLAQAVDNAWLDVDGCGLRAKFFLDGREIGFSVKPWSRLEYATGPLTAGEHVLTAALDSIVDNRKVKLFWNFYDFHCFGGFYHGVKLKFDNRRLAIRTRDYRTGEIEIELVNFKEREFAETLVFDGARKVEAVFRKGRAKVTVPAFKTWTPESPNLHTVSVKGVSARFGIRQVATADKRITLNGKPIYLVGVNRHESHGSFGAATPRHVMFEDIKIIKEMGCNFIRGSHYTQCEAFLDLCDELGILVWEESLGWGNRKEQLADEEFCRLQEEITRDMVRRSINHPSIIVSAFLNEPHTELKCARPLVERLIKAIRDEDTGHLVTYATCRNKDDDAHYLTDIICYNTYPCTWEYLLEKGTTEEMRENIRQCHKDIVKFFRDKYKDDRPLFVSETGFKADYGVHDPRGRAQYTEDFQSEYNRLSIEEIFANPEICGVALWQYADAKTYTRCGYVTNRSHGLNTAGQFDQFRRPKLVVEAVRKLFKAKTAR